MDDTIEALQNKLTYSIFAKEQRTLMTCKLRQKIKERDNFTCCHCGNYIYKEPNLLLEVDHIVPIAKGGYMIEENLQTLCWVGNRHKGSKSNESVIKENTERTNKVKLKLNIVGE